MLEKIKNVLQEKIIKLNSANPVEIIDIDDNINPDKINSSLLNNEELLFFTFNRGKKNMSIIKLHKNDINNNLESLEKEANSYYMKRQYELAISKFLELIIYSNNPKPFYYRMLGFSYLRLGNIESAIKYLTIAEEASKYKKDKYNLSNLISKISKEENIRKK